MITDLPRIVLRRYQSGKHFSDVFTYKMAAKIDWQRYET